MIAFLFVGSFVLAMVAGCAIAAVAEIINYDPNNPTPRK